MTAPFLLAIDQGTTSTRAIVFDSVARQLGVAAGELRQYFPRPGWVEHDPEEIWQSVTKVVPEALAQARVEPRDIAAIGLTNQRETTLIWERVSGKSIGRALVWQDRRTSDFCREHQQEEKWLYERTGLILDPYFSATKFRWILDNEAGSRTKAEERKLLGGTIDSFLIWRLTGGDAHVTDATNASRTLLLNLRTVSWDEDLCRFFNVPSSLLPEVRSSAAEFGKTSQLGFLPDGIPILGVAGDQQASLFGQCGFQAGDAKCTYGTGAFFLQHTGDQPVVSNHRLLSTLSASPDSRPQYALEGSVFVAGAAVQWLRDGLEVLASAPEVEEMARESDPAQAVVLVPAFTGLGAPYWIPDARGAVFGLTRGTTARELSRAALEGVAFQVADLVEAAGKDAAHQGRPSLETFRVDGGMARNEWFLQFQADLLGLPVLQAANAESTALGAAFLAGLKAGVWKDLDSLRNLTKGSRRFEPAMADEERIRRRKVWQRAVRAVIDFYQPRT